MACSLIVRYLSGNYSGDINKMVHRGIQAIPVRTCFNIGDTRILYSLIEGLNYFSSKLQLVTYQYAALI
ncbi:hypothetical protein Q4R47_20000, partial [Morganella morganii]